MISITLATRFAALIYHGVLKELDVEVPAGNAFNIWPLSRNAVSDTEVKVLIVSYQNYSGQ